MNRLRCLLSRALRACLPSSYFLDDMARNTAMQPANQIEAANQQMPDDSSSLKRSSSTAISLLFSLEDSSERLGSSAPESMQEYDPVLEVQRIKQACALSESEQQLSHAVSEAKASSVLTTGSVQLSHVGSYLRSKYGHLVVVRNANIAKRPRSYLRMLRHKYLVCRGLEGMEGVDVLVDLSFKDHFILPHSCSWYAKLVAALPQDWIGTAAALAPLVGLMSAGMRLCFKQAGVPLPPWREGRAVLSKWVPEVFEDMPLPLVLLPDPTLRRILAPYHAPFRTALRTAGATAEPATPLSVTAAANSSSVCQPEHLQPLGSSGKPPLPRPPSGVALATASVKAAAAGAAGALLTARGSDTEAGSNNHGAHVPVVPDVPRKIIVGFPDQNILTTAVLQRFPAVCEVGSVGVDSGSAEVADAGVYVVRQLHQRASAAKQVLQQQQHVLSHAAAMRSAAVGSAITSVLTQQGDGTVHNGMNGTSLKPPPQQEAVASSDVCAVGSSNVYATEAAASQMPPVAKQTENHQQQRQQQPEHQQQHQQQQPQHLPRKARARPAFTSTIGVVTATCGNSPAVVINQHLLQQLQAPVTGRGVGQDSAVTGEQRHFKALDQLLPRMRTVRLGAA